MVFVLEKFLKSSIKFIILNGYLVIFYDCVFASGGGGYASPRGWYAN
jgi:hypothetical protein